MVDGGFKNPISGFENMPEKSRLPEDSSAGRSRLSKIKKSLSKSESKRSKRQLDDIKRLVDFTIVGRESRVVRFLNRINQYFIGIFIGFAPKEEAKLTGRIHPFEKDVNKVIVRLHTLREELENDDQFQFPALISSVIDPLIKEINRLEKCKETHITAPQQVRELQDYSQWIEKSKKWIDLCSNRKTHKDLIEKAFIEHTLQEFHGRIDRDLQVIQDYLNHCLNTLKVNDLDKMELKDQLELELSHHIFELYLLKDPPRDKTLEDLNAWRIEADAAREKHFSVALHAIDSNVEKLTHPIIIEENVDRALIEIQRQLSSLEEKIIQVEENVIKFKSQKSYELKKSCLMHLAKIEDEAHMLNSNLQLTHEDVDRVQKALEAISYLNEQLQ